MLSPHDITLLLLAAAAIAIVIVLIAKFKLHPFPALMMCSLGLGLAAGESVAAVLKSVIAGFGDIVANVGIVLAFGAMFGGLLAKSRGADRIASSLITARGLSFAPWTMAGLAMVLGLPVFFETGLVMMMPIIVAVGAQFEAAAKAGRPVPKGAPYLIVGLPTIAGLSVLHGLVPPHPGPLIAIAALHADIGETLLLGILIAIPTVIVSGPLFTLWAARHADARPPAQLVAEFSRFDPDQRQPGTATTVLTTLFPIALMMAKAAADLLLPPANPLRAALEFIGAPIVALLLGTLLAMFTFGFALGRSRDEVTTIMGDALPPIAAIMLVIGGGGAFKQTLVDLGLGATIAHAVALAHVTPLLLAWGTAVLIRIAVGSATVATVTTGGLLAATVAANPAINPSLVALAIGAGSLFFSNVNDAGFWLVKGYLGISLPDMFKTWSLLETIISVMGLVLVLLAANFV
ncbi:MAG TPA: gluconate:H+ symporter [Rhizomicrobium sp.]|jgi:GntP family gluconate:H+ symporter|nr:gluconate:H+ symporter [Rhizomicrobium sp.]